MERFQEEHNQAVQNLRIADHMLNVTYPLLNDPKLLLSVMDNTFLSLTHSMASILHYDRFFKRIPPFHDNFESKFNMFKLKSMPTHRIDKSIPETMLQIKELILLHRKSPVEFRKNGQFVICHENYETTIITLNQIKEFTQKAKQFINTTTEIVHGHERILRGSEGRIEAS